MLSFELFHAGRRRIILSLLAVVCLTIQGCQIQPLYSANSQTAASLQSIGIKPVDDRTAQVLRNRLIFLYSGGRGEPANPEYMLTLKVRGGGSGILREQLSSGITAQRYQATATFSLVDTRTGEEIGKGTRKVVTFYDQVTQEFANRRAQRDARNRAAEQLAEIIRADTASMISLYRG